MSHVRHGAGTSPPAGRGEVTDGVGTVPHRARATGPRSMSCRVRRSPVLQPSERSGRMAHEAAGPGQVVVMREIDAPPEDAWRAWTDPDRIRQWWGPTGFTCARADVDFRMGGTTLVTMQAPPEYGGF